MNEPKRHPAAVAVDKWMAERDPKASAVARANGVTKELIAFIEMQCSTAFLDGWHAAERHLGIKR